MKTLFVAWQSVERNWYPVGRLEFTPQSELARFSFQYIGGVKAAQKDGFTPFLAFPSLDKTYEAPALFAFFQNRVIQSSRSDFDDFVALLALPTAQQKDPMAILAVGGGTRTTDSLEVFPKLELEEGNRFSVRFLLHGYRYLGERAAASLNALREGDPLRVETETSNPKTGLALKVLTQDGVQIGWAPRYLVQDLLPSTSESECALSVAIARALTTHAGGDHRVLIELSGCLPNGAQPMSSPDYLPLARFASNLQHLAEV